MSKEYASTTGTALADPAAPTTTTWDLLTQDSLAVLPLASLIASLTNPRKTFDPAKLQALADDIAQKGVLQPIIVRPLPGARVADTDRHITHEIVAGERRYRAAVLAGLQSIPAMIRHLTDDQVLEVQIVENLQRDDLTDLEEAEGLEHLMHHSALTADQVGAKIGKSRSYVYTKIKLLDLCADARTSLRDGTVDASRALLVARIPDTKLQIKAMKEIVAGQGHYGNSAKDPMTYRQAAEHIQHNYMLKLSDARFEITAVDLVPDAGSCKTCTKRTGNEPDLFSDVKSADVCTDPPCFHKKEEAHAATLVAAAQAKGQTVISGKEAAELRGTGYQDRFKGYRQLDSVDDSPTDQPLRKIIGGLMRAEGIKPVVIMDPNRKGAMVECLPNEVVLKLLKTAQAQAKVEPKVTKEVQQLVNEKNAKLEAKAKDQFEREWRATLLADAWVTLRDDATIEAFTTNVHRYQAVRAAKSLSTADAEAICQLLNLGKVAPVSAVADYARETLNPELLTLLIIMQEASSPNEGTYGGRIANEGLLLVAGNVFGAELDDVVKEIKVEVKAKIWPKFQKAVVLTAEKKPPPAAPARKPKLSAADAHSGIAAAMQDADRAATTPPEAQQIDQATGFAAGQRVRITTDDTKLGTIARKWAGKEGAITKTNAEHDPDLYDVTFKGRGGGIAMFRTDQLEAMGVPA